MPEERREEQGQSSVGLFLLMQFAAKQIFGIGSSTTTADASVSGAVAPTDFAARPESLEPGAQYNGIPQTITPMWPAGTELDISIYVTPPMIMPPLERMPADMLVLEETAFGFGGNDKREIDATINVPKEVQHNGTLWAHFYVAKTGHQKDPTASDYDTSAAYHFARPLSQYLPKKKAKKTRNLLSDSAEGEEEDFETGPTFVSYYHPNFTMSFIPDSGIQKYPTMHPALRSFVQLERTGARDSSGQNGWYYPILFVNTFWQLRDQMMELNDTVSTLPLHITLKNQPNWQFSLIASIDMGMKETARNAANNQGQMTSSGDGSEFEMFKEILLSSNPYLLATTGVVSVLHMIFEMLAFKSDVSHWRNKKDNVGTSFRTILANVIMQTIIFLYLMDNNENTSWMILFGQGMGILVEAWKITKTVDVRVRATAPGALIPYTVVFEDKHQLSETEKKTQEYDEIAFKYLYLVAIPLLLAYAGYSLLYETHKSWYSFIIATLVGSVYAYGFLMMVPSLYINYRLKSVAHMPAKAMTYKFLNTFIDDLFAFTIKMPTLHRLATLRDDLIFFVYLYQSWKYKVDYTRVNEFGQGGDDEDDKDKLAAKPLTSLPGADASVGESVEAVKTAEKEVSAKASGSDKKKGDGRKRK